MTADMTDAREKLDLAMKAAREVISQLEHLATAPDRTKVNDSDAKRLYTGVMEDLEEFYGCTPCKRSAIPKTIVGNVKSSQGKMKLSK